MLVQNYVTWREEANSVEEALFNLTTSLDDYRGQYNELQILEETVSSLESFIRVSLSIFVCLYVPRDHKTSAKYMFTKNYPSIFFKLYILFKLFLIKD